MTTLTFGGFRTAPRTTHASHGLIAVVSRSWDHWLARRAMAELGDEALHDIGVGRSEIADAVAHGRQRRA